MLNAEDKTACVRALQRPQARVALGLALRGVANSAIDISDGLVADLGHILKQSKVGATLYWEDIPKLKTQNIIDSEIAQETTLAGGDDYELCFTTHCQPSTTASSIRSAPGIGLSSEIVRTDTNCRSIK